MKRPAGRVSLRRGVDQWGDVALAAALTVFVQASIWTDDGYLTGNRSFFAFTGLLMTAPLAWRRRFPLGVALFAGGTILLQVVVEKGPHPPDAPFLAWIVTAYSVAAHASFGRALAGGTLLVVAVDLWAYRTGDDLVFIPVILAGFWLAGRVVRSRNLLAAQLAERTRELEQEREERAMLAVAEERTRIARELHDVVSHTLGVIVLQAGAERVAPDAASAGETLRSIEQSGRAALAEMGRLVGMLRSDGDVAQREPQPGLVRLDDVVGRVRAGGIDVETVIEGEARSLPVSLDVSAFRIVQEALTNAARHSRCSRVRVLLRWEATALEIQVADDGLGPSVGGSRSGGHGLLGIRERVALFGGVFATGRSDLGGFLLTARLPLPS